MKRGLFLIVISFTLGANAQEYLISFAGTGASATVNSVKVENLTTGTNINLNGGDILRLTGTVGISQTENGQSSEIKIYPNPMIDNSILQIYPPVAGNAVISMVDITGKLVAQISGYLDNYLQEFRLSGISRGFYMVSVKGNTYQYSGKFLCSSNEGGAVSIEKISTNQAVDKKTLQMDNKGTKGTVDMVYTAGERLKFTGISGIYSTVVTAIPDADKTITFDFIPCTDGDGNNYPVVNIGSQNWMAENLKTTKYNDGSDIPQVTDNTTWSNLLTPGYTWYDKEPGFKNTYGALYNWYTVNIANLCPSGWGHPTDSEWTSLIFYLGGESVAGSKLKATGITIWSSPNSLATNETGFTGIPGGYRNSDGTFSSINYYSSLWSATGYDATYAGGGFMSFDSGAITVGEYNKKLGFSVRCIKK